MMSFFKAGTRQTGRVSRVRVPARQVLINGGSLARCNCLRDFHEDRDEYLQQPVEAGGDVVQC